MKKSMDDSQEKNKQRKPGNKDIAQLEIVVRKEWEYIFKKILTVMPIEVFRKMLTNSFPNLKEHL